jgi:hypothetical protein
MCPTKSGFLDLQSTVVCPLEPTSVNKTMTEVWYQFAQVDGTPLNGFASSLTIPSPATVDKLRKDLLASNRNTFEGVDACDISFFESAETLKDNTPLGAALNLDTLQTSSKRPVIVAIVATGGPSKLVPEIAEAHEMRKAVLSQMAKTAKSYLDTFQQRSEIISQIKDISERQKQRTDSGFIPNNPHHFMNQPGYHQLSQNEQLAKRQDYERKNLEHSQDEQRKSTLLQENQGIGQTRNGVIQVMEQLEHVSAMLFRQIVGFASGLPGSEEE